MARALKDINVGLAMMLGVASGYYIYEPLLRKHEIRRRAEQQELEALAEAVEEPVEKVSNDLSKTTYAPFTRWLLYRGRDK
jgi:hypothetical protein